MADLAAVAVGPLADGMPTFKGRPGWEFTDLSALDVGAYQPCAAAPEVLGTPASAVGSLWRFDMPKLPDGVTVAFQDDTTVLTVARGTVLQEPLGLTVVVPEGALYNQRTRVVLEPGAQAEVWEQYLSDGDCLLNLSTELHLGDGASLRYFSGQSLSEQAWIFGSQHATVSRDAQLDWVALGFGSRSGHVLMQTRLAGQGAQARVTGAYAARGAQHIDFDTTQEHVATNTTSDLAFRGVLQGRSSAVWKGNIIVDPGAQKTDAFQESRNLLLSKRAHADAIPGLEIQANDVRCTHAAAVAQVDPEQIFYLRSHGLREAEAKRLLIEGFLGALLERFQLGALRETLGVALERRLAELLDADPVLAAA
ncbi:MAG: Fe-S cluster assembly protein SufD [Solirubrobacteraceae bacterium]